jgi:hypothetical protein
MNQDSVIDKMVKIPLLTDMMNLIGIQPCKRSKQDIDDLAKGYPLPGMKIDARTSLSIKQATSWNESNFKTTLDADNYSVLFETDEENQRLGNFVRVLPDATKPIELLEMQDRPKVNNYLVHRYVELQAKGINILDTICDAALKG